MKHNSVAPLRSIPPIRRTLSAISIILSIVIALAAFGAPAAAATISVTSTNDGGAGSLRQAIANAAPGDTITFSLPANSSVTLTSGELLINKNLTISGPGANLLTIERNASAGDFRIFDITANINVTITGLTIVNGNSPIGGGIYNNGGTLTVASSTISGNQASGSNGYGGGIYNEQGTVNVTNSTIAGNSSYDGGGIFNERGTVNVTNSTVSGNSAAYDGGGIYNSVATLTITNSTIAGNSSDHDGGGIYNFDNFDTDTTLNVRNTIIATNSAPNSPDVDGTVVSQGYVLIGNTSGTTITTGSSGTTTGNQLNVNPLLGPLQNNGGPTQTHALLSGSPAVDKGHSSGSNTDQRGLARPVDDPSSSFPNASGGDGADIGAYEVQADILPGCSAINRVVNNNNDSGTGSLRDVIASVCAGSTITFAQNVRGAINLTSGELMINKSLTISGPGANLLSVQRSTDSGTAEFRIFEIGQVNIDVTLSGLTVANGKISAGSGGGIVNQSGGTLTVMGCAVSGNTASGNGTGGGIFNLGTMTLTSSTISGNSAPGGGGIENLSIPFRNSTLTIINSTFSGNSAAGTGAGIENFRVVIPNQPIPVGTVNLTNSTLSGNPAGNSGGGIFNQSGNTVNVRNTIIALNTAPTGPDVQGSLTSENFNLIGSSAGAAISPAQFSDQIGTPGSPIDPLLDSLRDNGGPTLTHALLSGSRAIDKGESSGSPTDQRGVNRPVDQPGIVNASGGDGGDIGAFEFGGALPSPAALANISTRLRVETGDNVLIGGFIITGTQPKKVIIRALGPSVPVPGALADPVLELYSGPTLLESNDNWVDSPNKQAIIDSTIPPPNNLESAIVRTLPANGSSYTAIMRGVSNGTGIGVVEAYDLDRTVDSKLANISTRGFVQTGDNVLFAGTIVVGQGSQKVIIRALGPSIGVPGAMADPTLELHELVIEQPFFSPEATAVTAERAVGADDAVAGNDDGEHVRAVRAADGATRVRDAETFRHPGIGTCFRDRESSARSPRRAFGNPIRSARAGYRTRDFRRRNNARAGNESHRDNDALPARRSSSSVGAESIIHFRARAGRRIRAGATPDHPRRRALHRAASRFVRQTCRRAPLPPWADRQKSG